MNIGYVRVSSLGQSLDTQIEKLQAFGCEKIFREKASAASTGRREPVKEALEFCREGVVLVITKLDRLARSMFDLQGIVQPLERKKADLVILDQKIDTTTPTGRLTFHLLGAVAEFERELINERRNEGMERAKEKGVRFGRKPKLTDERIEELRAAYGAGEQRNDLMKRFGISKATFYRACPSHPKSASEELNQQCFEDYLHLRKNVLHLVTCNTLYQSYENAYRHPNSFGSCP